jgi:predicted nucleotidyltransferase
MVDWSRCWLNKERSASILIIPRYHMQLEELREIKRKLYQIAAKNGIRKLYVFGSVARDISTAASDIDFLIELEEDASALGVGAFQYEAQELLGVHIDVILTFALDRVSNRDFVKSVQSEAVAL